MSAEGAELPGLRAADMPQSSAARGVFATRSFEEFPGSTFDVAGNRSTFLRHVNLSECCQYLRLWEDALRVLFGWRVHVIQMCVLDPLSCRRGSWCCAFLSAYACRCHCAVAFKSLAPPGLRANSMRHSIRQARRSLLLSNKCRNGVQAGKGIPISLAASSMLQKYTFVISSSHSPCCVSISARTDGSPSFLVLRTPTSEERWPWQPPAPDEALQPVAALAGRLLECRRGGAVGLSRVQLAASNLSIIRGLW